MTIAFVAIDGKKIGQLDDVQIARAYTAISRPHLLDHFNSASGFDFEIVVSAVRSNSATKRLQKRSVKVITVSTGDKTIRLRKPMLSQVHIDHDRIRIEGTTANVAYE